MLMVLAGIQQDPAQSSLDATTLNLTQIKFQGR